MTKKLRVAIVSRSNSFGGGASRIAEDLAGWLVGQGSDVTHFCALPVGPLKAFQAPLYLAGFIGGVSRVTHSMSRRMGFNALLPIEFFTTLGPGLSRYDVVHFHDLHSAISPISMYLCAKKRPVVFTAHDCSCFTGGCIYPLECERFRKSCGYCPQLRAMGARFDCTGANVRLNRWMAKQSGVQYVFPSAWLRDTAAGSLQFRKSAKIIPNGFLPDGYAFRSKRASRRELGIRDDQRVILVAAHYLGEPRKGVAFALSAICAMADLDPLVLFVGIPPTDLEQRIPGISFWQTGFVRDQRRLGLIFAAADVFLFTSLQDNLPIMIQEALAAGTAVVGFSAGGVPEMVDHGRTGWLCPIGDQLALNRNLRDALTGNQLVEYGEAARTTISERFNMDVFGQRHLNLYEEMAK